MRAAFLREKAEEYLRLARGLSSHSPTRHYLITLAERFERRAKELETEVGLRITAQTVDNHQSAEKQHSAFADFDSNKPD